MLTSNRPVRSFKICLFALAALFIGSTASAASSLIDKVTPTAVFIQAGVAENQTNAYVLGAIWDWQWRKQYSFGTLTGYAEASFGRWTSKTGDTSSSAWVTQLGITPVFRLQPAVFADWFIEAGIGANLILPIYRSSDKSFSTEFNFGDHIALGRWLDKEHRRELSMRFQHFSNAGIDHPNPGENFVQMRYAHRF